MSILSYMRRIKRAGYVPNYEACANIRSIEYPSAANVATGIWQDGPNPNFSEIERLNNGLAFILPTFVGRSAWPEQKTNLNKILEQFSKPFTSQLNCTVIVFLFMQWKEEEESEALFRLEEFQKEVIKQQPDVQIIGVSLKATGKMYSLNVAFTFLRNIQLKGVGWLDDDVLLEPGCLLNLSKVFLQRHAAGTVGAVGATKIGHPNTQGAARMLYRIKSITRPAMNYPHGCCILVDHEVVRDGIPMRYASDDGFVCFELMDIKAEDPMWKLYLVPDAICHHQVGGPAGQIRRRIFRILLNHHVLLMDAPKAVARYYFKNSLFYGLWPLAPFDRNLPWREAILKMLLKYFYFLWYCRVGAELFFRGLFRKPLTQIPWGGYQDYKVPEVNSN